MPDPQLREMNLRLIGIASVLQGRPLRVPAYQRSYSWKPAQVTAFWRDLQTAMLTPGTDYFMGTIVLSLEAESGARDRRVTVIDGQQRLATASILLACVRDYLLASGDTQRSRGIANDFLTLSDLRSGAPVPRLCLNEEDADFFAEHIISTIEKAAPSTYQFPSNRRLHQAYELLAKHLSADLEIAGAQWIGRLADWIEFLQDRVRVISIQVESDADAFLIFETLNDRGLGLTIADLLKNHLLHTAQQGPSAQSVQQAWLAIVTAFPDDRDDDSDNGGGDAVTTFIRHYWSSLHGPTRERELYQSLRRRIRGSEQATDLVQQLASSAPSYAALLDGDHYRWQELEMDRALSDSILRLGLEQPRPLLLAAMDVLQREELRQLLASSVAWGVRGLITGGIGGGSTERYYAQAAEAVRSGRARTVMEVERILVPILPTDGQFEAAFGEKRVNSPRLAKYYLAAVQASLDGRPEPALLTESELEPLALLHVLPRRANADDWGFPDDNLSQWVLRLGNQVLVEQPLKTVRAQSYNERLAQLQDSQQKLAQLAFEHRLWTPTVIDRLQRQLAAAAVHVWPLQSTTAL